ncbi:hypothetical protein AX15_001682 [Amanita polypyramis BW_CC]|nr:hypothetical protein AX15_001682 [Amanita polypyramis BW_CC]
MSSNLSLPSDVFREIFSYCEPKNITETCQEFAYIAYSVPSLWSSIHLGPLQYGSDEGPVFLRKWLERTRALPLTISIGPVSATSTGASSCCATISEYNDRIRRLEIVAETDDIAGDLLEDIYPDSSQIFSALQVLSIRVEDDEGSRGPSGDALPGLDRVLEGATELFPKLQTLSLPSFYDCIPMLLISNPPFNHLHTLILDGSLESDAPDIGLVTALLHYTPQLETFWFKHSSEEQFSSVNDPFQYIIKGRADVRVPAHLPRLTNLAISVAGSATDIIECIRAPALRYLHIDGSRNPKYDDPGWDFTDYRSSCARWALKLLAEHSPDVLHLAVTSVYLTNAGWEWLLFGEQSSPVLPFPQLQSLSLHGHEPLFREVEFGFDDALLRRYAREPRLQLRKLAFFRCNLALDGSLIVEAFRKVVKVAPYESYELEFDGVSPQFSEEDLTALADLGVKLIRHQEVNEYDWWDRGNQIDASDSHAYSGSPVSMLHMRK